MSQSCLPRRRSTPRVRPARARHSFRLACAQHPRAVLVVYPAARTRNAIAALLVRHGYQVTACADGREANLLLKAGAYDLVLTGLVMPDMDGLELLRAMGRRKSPPPVIALSDHEDGMGAVYMRSAILFGAISAHTVPVDSATLFASIDTALGQQTRSILQPL